MTDIHERRALRQARRFFRSHVENCLKSIWETHELVTDSDEDYPFASGTMPLWVSVRDDLPPSVRVFAYVAADVRRSKKLLAELNEINAVATLVRVYWHADTVVVEAGLPYAMVDQCSLRALIHQVTIAAEELGEVIAIVHGGRRPFDGLELSPSEEDIA